MFRSFRRKPVKKSGQDDDNGYLRMSPSLPELSASGIPWPEDLVDMASIRQTPPPDHPFQGATRISLQSPTRDPIPFHKPTRAFPGTVDANGTISSLYMSNGPPAFDNWRGSTGSPVHTTRLSHRRARVPPQFNVLVVGGQGTGKTSLLRLLLDTADISPSATAEQRASLEHFTRGPVRRTQEIQTATVEISESRFDRVLLSVTDTPGLDFSTGRELKLERQVSNVVKYIDSLFAETMSEESKVVRQSKGDRHVHLCIYIIDPSSILSAAERRNLSSLPVKTRSDTTISNRHPDDTPPLTDDNESEDEDAASEKLTMSQVELRVIRRLAQRANVLPVVGHADSLTDERLTAVRQTVRRELHQAELGFGVFEPAQAKETQTEPSDPDVSMDTTTDEITTNGTSVAEDIFVDDNSAADVSKDVEERRARPVIKLRTGRRLSSTTRQRSRSRSRIDLESEARDNYRPVSPDPTDIDSVANARFSAHAIARKDLSELLPFALISPEHTRRHRIARPWAPGHDTNGTGPDREFSAGGEASEDGHAMSISTESPMSPSGGGAKNPVYWPHPPEDLRGVFTRQFRWGTVDVLEPGHCDFAALRTAMLSTHMKVLKTHTKEVLYEKYRTEKLLVRRATQKIGDKEARRLFEDLGL